MGTIQIKDGRERKVSREQREFRTSHRSAIVWFTGLSGAGKTTVARAVEERLHRIGYRTCVLDGDKIRQGLCRDLGFSAEDRAENIRRIGEVAKLFMEAGLIVLVAVISPFRKDRDRVRRMTSAGEYFEVYCRCPLLVCEQRDPKGLYLRARAGDLHEFTGISSPYEEPQRAEVVIETDRKSVEECVKSVGEMMVAKGIVRHEWTTP